jgi:LPS sulfotransferase NodH
MDDCRRPVAWCAGRDPWLVWALCADARSGSTWLSQLAASTQCLGIPDEYLLNWPRWCGRLGLAPETPWDEYVAALLRLRSTPNGVFGIKGSLAQLADFFALFPAAPCVWLTRENKLEQAVSWQRANDGGLWHRTVRTRAASPPPTSIERILGFYDELVQREAAWRAFFQQRAIAPLHLTYEAVCRDPLAAVRAIAEHVGVEAGAIRAVHSPLCILRDGETEQWVRRAALALAARTRRPEDTHAELHTD